MKELVAFVQPTMAVITSVGHSHLEGIGNLQDVANEKKKIFSLFNESNIGIINGDSLLLTQSGYIHPVIRFGKRKYNQIQARAITIVEGRLHFTLKIYHNSYKVSFDTTHESYVYLVLAAVAIAYHLEIDEKIIVEAIQQPVKRYRRFEKKPLNYTNSFLIDDAYNASPESMTSALLAFDKIPWKGKKIAVLGDMRELGPKSLTYHKKVGRLFFKLLSIDQLILVGNQVHCMSKVVPKTLSVITCVTLPEAQIILDKLLTDDVLVLFKASLGMNFIELVNHYSTPYKAITL
jgi:UDP-N-acetylmuramoyl-tripeptide--D-alanyl-D-alanine ligase